MEDEYFKSRNLYPNVDFYSGIIYRALGIPSEMFTVMFAIGRLPGWIAQWIEMRSGGEPLVVLVRYTLVRTLGHSFLLIKDNYKIQLHRKPRFATGLFSIFALKERLYVTAEC